MTDDQRTLDMVKFIADESIKLLSYITKKPTLNVTTVSKYVAYFIDEITRQVLHSMDASPLSDEEKYKEVSKTFLSLKLGIAESVGVGLSHAMKEFAGQKVDYYCDIQIVPETKNKLPC